jgi:hypothetical protein
MRTTITLESDVAALVKRTMRERDVTFKRAVNDAIRAGLGPKRGESAGSFPVFDMGEPHVDLTKALRLAGELEDEEIVRELDLGK